MIHWMQSACDDKFSLVQGHGGTCSTYMLRHFLAEHGGIAFNAAFLGNGEESVEDYGMGFEGAGDDVADDARGLMLVGGCA